MIGKFDLVFVLELRDPIFFSPRPLFSEPCYSFVLFIYLFSLGTIYDSPFNGENTGVKRWISEYRSNMELLLQRLSQIHELWVSLCALVGFVGKRTNSGRGSGLEMDFFLMTRVQKGYMLSSKSWKCSLLPTSTYERNLMKAQISTSMDKSHVVIFTFWMLSYWWDMLNIFESVSKSVCVEYNPRKHRIIFGRAHCGLMYAKNTKS